MIEIVLATLLNTNTPVLSTIEMESVPHVSTSSVHISSPHISEQLHASPSIPAPSTFSIGRTSSAGVDIARTYSSRPYSPPSRTYSPPSPQSRPTVNLNTYNVARPSTPLSPSQRSLRIESAPRTPSGAINLSNYPVATPKPKVSPPTPAPAKVYVPRTNPAPPAPTRVYANPAPYRERPVIIRENNSIIDNPWFWMSMFNNNQRPQTVIQQPAPIIQQAPNGSIVAQPATQQPIVQRASTGNFFLNFMVVVLIVVVIGMGIALLKLRR
ncbi:hypothetical protein b3_0208 [Synechococcus phage B3]|nr:hypothetical protein b3_0208 [Synechococcus phage B3]QGT54821.1 hypothetical protein b23_0206 [Synechococcus phage B23]